MGKVRLNPYGITEPINVDCKLNKRQVKQLVKVWEKLGLEVRLKKNGEPLKRQFYAYLRRQRTGELLLKHFNSIQKTNEILQSAPTDQLLTHDQMQSAFDRYRSGEIAKEDFRKLLLYQYRLDPLYMATRLFKDMLTSPSSPNPLPPPQFHRTLMDLYTDPSPSSRRIAVAAPRGHSKSTLTGFFFVMHQALFQKKRNIVIVSATQDLAIRFLRDIKSELQHNKKLIWLFGPQQSDKWSEKEIHLNNGCVIYAKGRGGQVRGLKEKGRRPDLVICDDMEDEEQVRSELRRIDMEDWFNGALLPTLDPRTGQLIFIGTILHQDALLARLLNPDLYPEFVSKRYAALNDQDEPLWPEMFTKKHLLDLKASALRRGKLATFYMEYMNNPIPTEDATFRKEYFTYFTELPHHHSHYSREMFVDLGGGSVKKTADDTSMLVLFTDPETGDMFVQDYISKPFGTDTARTLDALLSLAHTHNVTKVYIEKTVASNMLCAALDREMKQRRHHLRVEYVSPTRGSGDRRGNMSDGKFQRIAQMEAPIKLGVIKFRPWMDKLEEQLLAFPRGRHDDLCLVGETLVATPTGDRRIDELTQGDLVLTPLGPKRITAHAHTGSAPTITVGTITGTPDHPVFTHNEGFKDLDALCYNDSISHLSCKSLCLWKYQKLLSLMGQPSVSWEGKESITYLSQIQIKGGRILKDFMWRFGNMLMAKQYLRAMWFTTSMVTRLITTLKTWSVYRVRSTSQCICARTCKKILSFSESVWTTLAHSLQNGISLKREEPGMQRRLSISGRIQGSFQLSVASAKKVLSRFIPTRNFALANASNAMQEPRSVTTKIESVRFAQTPSQSTNTPSKQSAHASAHIKNVYDITVEDAHCFYAGGVLVGNCDALSYGYMYGKRARKKSTKKRFRPSTRYGYSARSEFRTAPGR